MVKTVDGAVAPVDRLVAAVPRHHRFSAGRLDRGADPHERDQRILIVGFGASARRGRRYRREVSAEPITPRYRQERIADGQAWSRRSGPVGPGAADAIERRSHAG